MFERIAYVSRAVPATGLREVYDMVRVANNRNAEFGLRDTARRRDPGGRSPQLTCRLIFSSKSCFDRKSKLVGILAHE